MSKKRTNYVEIVWFLPIGDQVNEIREYNSEEELNEYIAKTTLEYGWTMDEVFDL